MGQLMRQTPQDTASSHNRVNLNTSCVSYAPNLHCRKPKGQLIWAPRDPCLLSQIPASIIHHHHHLRHIQHTDTSAHTHTDTPLCIQPPGPKDLGIGGGTGRKKKKSTATLDS